MALIQRITAYLFSGGLFNPEMANHQAVRDLLTDARAEFTALRAENERLRGALTDVLDRIERSEEWWMSEPTRGGFDVPKIRTALNGGS